MKKVFVVSIGSLVLLSACNSGGTSPSSGNSQQLCPANAPLFTAELGEELINIWGSKANYYSPTGNGGFTDPYVGAVYFTGAEYLSNAVLVPTLSPVTRVGVQNIYDYFTHFLQNNPIVTVNPIVGGTTLAGCGYGVTSGDYNFDLSPLGGTPSIANARYTFQFQYLANPSSVSITIESGIESGAVKTIAQPAGWYVMLQNSALKPAATGIAPTLMIK